MLHEDRRRAESFGDDPEQYDRARPSYPAALIDDLAGPGVARVLDVGCGTGISSRLFAERGCRVLGVEQDERMAALARRAGIEVEVAAFETWEPPPEPFDLVAAAQSWHWVDPHLGLPNVARALRPGGRFGAFWNRYAPEPGVQALLAEAYARHAPGMSQPLALAGNERADQPHHLQVITACGLFEDVEKRRYPWQQAYTRDEWLESLETQSNHRTLDPVVRQGLFEAVAAIIDGAGGQLIVDHSTTLITARRPTLCG